MRKSISYVLCFILIFVLCGTRYHIVYGDTNDNSRQGSSSSNGAITEVDKGLGTHGQPVRVKMTGKCEIVYKVDISWGDMNFIYTTGGSHVWNEKTHLYEEKYVSTWTGTDNYIKLVNHSNTEVDAKFTYVNKGIHTGVIGSFKGGDKLSLPSAEGKPLDSKEIVGSRNLLLDGVLSNTLDRYIKLGAVNVEIK